LTDAEKSAKIPGWGGAGPSAASGPKIVVDVLLGDQIEKSLPDVAKIQHKFNQVVK
jgi:hypothetical protein